MPTIVEYIVTVLEIEAGEVFDVAVAGTNYKTTKLIAASYDDNEQDIIMTIDSPVNGIEAVPYKTTVPLIPVVVGQAVDVPAATPQLTTDKISYILGWRKSMDFKH